MTPTAADLVRRVGGPGPRPASALRRRAFVEQQELFARDDGHEHDGAAHTIVLVAVAAQGEVLGGVRLHPEGDDPGLGWWP
jgi:hypothetical protein